MFLSQLKWLNILCQNGSIFLSVHREKKFSHFDYKSWVTGGIKIQPNFLSQNDSIFRSVHREKKLSHFDPKTWVIVGTKIWQLFMSKWLNFLLLAPREIIESF